MRTETKCYISSSLSLFPSPPKFQGLVNWTVGPWCYPIFNDRAAKGATVANGGQHGRSLRHDQNGGAQIWKIGRLSLRDGRLPTACSACSKSRFPPAGGPFLHGPGNQFSGAHDHVSAPHYFIPLSRSRLYRGLMRRAGNRWRTNKRVYLLNKADCPSPRIAFYFAHSHDSRITRLSPDRSPFP